MVAWLLVAASPTETVDLGFVELGWLKVMFLGLVQGVTELLPISSTAHLRLVPSLLGWPDPGSAFSAAMQLASLAAVLTYFWSDIKSLTGGMVRAVTQQDYGSYTWRLGLGLLGGTLPIVVVGLLLKQTLNAPGSPLRSLTVVGVASIVMALLLALAEVKGQRQRSFEQLTLSDGLLVGLAQALALIPGVSRSGSTLTAGLFLGMERATAARFSFLLGLPAVVLAGAVELHALLHAGLEANGWFILLVGLVSASLAAFAAIYGLLRYLEQQSTWIFVWYRLVMGLLLVVGAAQGWLH